MLEVYLCKRNVIQRQIFFNEISIFWYVDFLLSNATSNSCCLYSSCSLLVMCEVFGIDIIQNCLIQTDISAKKNHKHLSRYSTQTFNAANWYWWLVYAIWLPTCCCVLLFSKSMSLWKSRNSEVEIYSIKMESYPDINLVEPKQISTFQLLL